MSEVYIQLKPFGINLSPTGAASMPLLLLKDSSGELTLPIPIHPIDAGILMQQSGKAVGFHSPYMVTEQVLKIFQVKVERCLIHEVRNSQIYCRLEFSNQMHLDIKAESGICFAMYLNIGIFATRDVIWKARTLSLELQAKNDGLLIFQTSAIRPHEYLM